jgi:purine-nucleoside phosphorylase
MNDSDFIFGARDLLGHLHANSRAGVLKLPKTSLMCLSPSVADQLAKGQAWRIERSLGGKWTFVSDALVLASGFGLGAPACAAKLEEMKVMGVERVVFIGTAGALQSDIHIGDVVLAQSAHSAEGTSKHYSTASKFEADPQLLTETAKILKNKNVEYRIGTAWSTDAPYRERRSTLQQLQNRGVMCVDMEASAMYAVARAIGVKTAGVFIVSDGLSHGKWKPAFGHATLREKFMSVANILSQNLAGRK